MTSKSKKPTADDPRLLGNIYDAKSQELAAKREEQANARAVVNQQRIAANRKLKEDKANEAWKKCSENAYNLYAEGVKGFTNWFEAMNDILTGNRLLFEAMRATNPLGSVGGKVSDLVIPMIKAKLVNRDTGEVILPDLNFHLHSNDEDEFDVTEFFTSENVPLTDEQRNIVMTGLIMWLKDQGWEPEAQGSMKFVNEDGEHLTNETFQTLCQDNDLNGFFSGRYGLKFNQQDEPITPAPVI